MAALTRTDIKKIEEYWININDYKKQMKFREWELMNPYNETDTNIGGGKSNVVSDTTARKALVLADDTRYQYLKRIVTTIDQLYKELDDDQKTIVNMRYWDKDECYEWQHVGDKLYMSVQRVLRKRNSFLNETAKRLGWM